MIPNLTTFCTWTPSMTSCPIRIWMLPFARNAYPMNAAPYAIWLTEPIFPILPLSSPTEVMNPITSSLTFCKRAGNSSSASKMARAVLSAVYPFPIPKNLIFRSISPSPVSKPMRPKLWPWLRRFLRYSHLTPFLISFP